MRLVVEYANLHRRGDCIIAAISGVVFLFCGLLSGYQDDLSLALLITAICALASGVVFLTAVVTILISMYTALGRGPDPKSREPVPINKTTPCDARG